MCVCTILSAPHHGNRQRQMKDGGDWSEIALRADHSAVTFVGDVNVILTLTLGQPHNMGYMHWLIVLRE